MIVYLIGVLNSLIGATHMLMAISLASSVVGGFAVAINHEHGYREGDSYASDRAALSLGKKMFKYSAFSFATLLLLSVIIPSKETAYVMVAAYGVEGIVSDERVQQLGDKSLDVIEQWLDELAPAQDAPQ